MRLQDHLNRVPSRFLILFVCLTYYLWLIIALLLWPVVLLYGFVLVCPLVWMKWGSMGKDLLVVYANEGDAKEWSDRIFSLVGTRAVVLDYSERAHWPRWSLASQVFGIFGPHPIPESLMRYYLPAVIVLKRNQKPKKFCFGNRKKDREALFVRLRSEL